MAVDCVNLDRAFGGDIKLSEEYQLYRAVIPMFKPVHCYFALNKCRDNYVDIFYRGGQYVPNVEVGLTRGVVEVAFYDLLKSALVLHGHYSEKTRYVGMSVEDMTPV